ncbi:hypothetical protein ONA24_06430 [Mycoplasmopsis cynos]|uniref:hypothetical protein n=1 Tax=Mycoplasmopsis cynos TaxID=171284 RepID=UPI0024CAB0F7|nr:hypothetical protein [Mycoplasmopsis cynos]WAM09583.1 hypothetical protein ONA24_06430 [Mycoplasmopsis cynos]
MLSGAERVIIIFTIFSGWLLKTISSFKINVLVAASRQWPPAYAWTKAIPFSKT